MDEHPKYFHISESENEFILDNRVEISLKEIVIYPLAIFIFIWWGTGHLLPAIFIAIIVGFLYSIIRFLSWYIYDEIIINKDTRQISMEKKFIGKTRDVIKIDEEYSKEKIRFSEQRKSGKVKFLMTYSTYKNFHLMVIQNLPQKEFIENKLPNF